VGQVWGARGADRYLLDQVRGRKSFTDTLAAVRKLSAKWPNADLKLVEDKANGPAVIDTLRSEISGLVAVNPEGGKLARASAVSPQVEAKNVWLPSPDTNPWVADFVQECANFPAGAHDDQVDAMSQALLRLKQGALPFGWFDDVNDQDGDQRPLDRRRYGHTRLHRARAARDHRGRLGRRNHHRRRSALVGRALGRVPMSAALAPEQTIAWLPSHPFPIDPPNPVILRRYAYLAYHNYKMNARMAEATYHLLRGLTATKEIAVVMHLTEQRVKNALCQAHARTGTSTNAAMACRLWSLYRRASAATPGGDTCSTG